VHLESRTAEGVHHTHRENFGVPVHARNANAVVALGGDDARHVRAVTVIVFAGAAYGIIGVTARPYRRPENDSACEIRMIRLHTGIEYRDDQIAGSLMNGPRFRRINVSVDNTAALTGVVHVPLPSEIWICRHQSSNAADAIDLHGFEHVVERAQ